jgi:hypothetical protein
MRQAPVARAVNVVRPEAWAEAANLIYRHGRISGCSGILFEKKIERKTRVPITSGQCPALTEKTYFQIEKIFLMYLLKNLPCEIGGSTTVFLYTRPKSVT